jgi:Ras family protein T1
MIFFVFQQKCFKTPLHQQELEGVKQVVRENDEAGLSANGITESGFLYLHAYFIQKGRLETTWTVLRAFGYGDDLSLREDFLRPHLDIPPDATVELSSTGHAFFTNLFRMHDQDHDGALSEIELSNLFLASPGNPWDAMEVKTLTTDQDAMTLQGFLSLWAMTTLLDSTLTLAYLAYLGFDGDTRAALKVIRNTKKATVPRSSFLCYVFGGAGVGKSRFLSRFVQQPYIGKYSQTKQPFTAVNVVEVKGRELTLAMQEFGSKYEADVLSNPRRLAQCDVACFVYDSSDANSFSYVAELIVRSPWKFAFQFSDRQDFMVFTRENAFVFVEFIKIARAMCNCCHKKRFRFSSATLRSATRRILPPPGTGQANSYFGQRSKLSRYLLPFSCSCDESVAYF